MERPVAVLYEHPQWFLPLFDALDRRGIPYERLHAADLVYDPADLRPQYSLVVNRMSPSAWTRGHGHAIFKVRDFLAHVESTGTPVLNGLHAYELELSKARQLSLFARHGLPHPRTAVASDAAGVRSAATRIGFPLLVKPNVGGSGAGISAFESADELAGADIDFGLDGTVLVQEQVPARDAQIVRLEFLRGELLYAIRILLIPGSFNLCPADYCELPGIADGVSGRGLPVEAFDAPNEVVEAAASVVKSARLDLAGIEYLVDDRTGVATFYDLNALSNFVADAPTVVGFDPFESLVDLIEARALAEARAAA